MVSADKLISVVFVGFNRRYVNRSTTVLLRSISFQHKLSFFGPGYQPQAILDLGLSRWIESIGGCDLLIFDHYSCMFDAISKRKHPFIGDLIFFTRQEYFYYAPILKNEIEAYRGIKIFIANIDTYGVKQCFCDYLANLKCFVIDSSMEQLVADGRDSKSNINDATKCLPAGFLDQTPTDNWLKFKSRHSCKFLEVPHTIGSEEFSLDPISRRRNVFCVPGTRYSEREKVYKFESRRQRAKRCIHRVSDKIYGYINSSLTPERLAYLQLRYELSISSSKFAFVSGSVFRVPVRKYFEVAALGAVPIGHSPIGMSNIGFVNMENFVIAEQPVAVANFLECFEDELAQYMASNAQQLIAQKHSDIARSWQIADSFRSIIAGNFNGSYWHNGEYCHL